MNNSNQAFFVGGFQGTVKKEGSKYFGQPFYMLSFAVPAEQADFRFGGQVASVSVREDVFNEFKKKAKPYSYIKANVVYVRGGWSLFNYEL